MLSMQGDKTIDGRGAYVTIANGAGITIQFVKNVIIHNIKIKNIMVGSGGYVRDGVDHLGIRTRSDGDGISIFGSSNVWIDHVSMSRCMDGLVDAIEGSTAITISNSHFTDHNEVIISSCVIIFFFLSSNELLLVVRRPRIAIQTSRLIKKDLSHETNSSILFY